MAAEKRTRAKRVRSRDIPKLLDTLACDDPTAQADTLTLLCPCRNVRYDKEVWVAIFRAAQSSENHIVRDKAGHAIGTLRERARTDPRSQALVNWLVEQELAPRDLVEAVPTWRPWLGFNINGLAIPRYEAPVHSRHKRQRR